MSDFEKIYEEHSKMVYSFLMSLCHDEQLAEELTQETIFRAILNYSSFKGKCKLSGWLCQIAKNLYYDWYNKNKRYVLIAETEDNVSDGKDICLDLDDKETAMQILNHLHILEEPYKEVFMLHVLGDVSLKTISNLFGKSDSWARVTYYRAKSIIIENLKEENK